MKHTFHCRVPPTSSAPIGTYYHACTNRHNEQTASVKLSCLDVSLGNCNLGAPVGSRLCMRHPEDGSTPVTSLGRLTWQSQRILQIKKEKLSHYRPGEDQKIPGRRGSQISGQSEHEGGRVVRPTYAFTPLEIFLVLVSVRDSADPRAIVRL